MPRFSRALSADRCGVGALSRAGPKPRQARDGHPSWMGPLFSFCQRAPRFSSTPVGAFRGADPGPIPLFPLSPRPRAWRGSGFRGRLTQRTILALRRDPAGSRPLGRAPPRGGGGRPAVARAAAPHPVLGGAPGALQVVLSGARGRVGGVASPSPGLAVLPSPGSSWFRLAPGLPGGSSRSSSSRGRPPLPPLRFAAGRWTGEGLCVPGARPRASQ